MSYLITGVVYKINVPARARNRLQTFGGRFTDFAGRMRRRDNAQETAASVDSTEAGIGDALHNAESRVGSLKTDAQAALSHVKDKAAQTVTARRDDAVAMARSQGEAAVTFARNNTFLLIALALAGALVTWLLLVRTKEDEGT